MLRSYPGPDAVAALRLLLKDDEAVRWNMSADTKCETYLVRVAAYDTLRDLGTSVERPLLEQCRKP
jgi:hypothetical protein